jgi:hypothetical protein
MVMLIPLRAVAPLPFNAAQVAELVAASTPFFVSTAHLT